MSYLTPFLFYFFFLVKDLTAANEVYSNCSKEWDDLLTTYSLVYEDMKVDRVIFVASAVNENLPHRLMDCVMSTARPSTSPEGFKRREYESLSSQVLSSQGLYVLTFSWK